MKIGYKMIYKQGLAEIFAVIDDDSVVDYESAEIKVWGSEDYVNISVCTMVNKKFIKSVNIECESREVAEMIVRDIRKDIQTSKIMWVNYFNLNLNFLEDEVIWDNYENIVNSENVGLYIWGRSNKGRMKSFLIKR